MYDSITAADIPQGVAMVAGYCDGLYRWSDQDWARFPDAVKVRIAVNPGTDDGQVGDVENFDMTPTGFLDWARRRRASGQSEVTAYCTEGSMSAIAQIFNGAGEREPHYFVATLDGRQLALGGSIVANQYAGQALSGGHYDLSNVLDYWPGVDGPGGGDALTDSEKRERVRTWFIAGLGREPSADDLSNFAGAVSSDGSNLEAIATGVYDSTEGQLWRAYLHTHSTPGVSEAELEIVRQALQAVRDTLHSA